METNPVIHVLKPAQKQERILALDVARGIVIAFMILVNNNGAYRFAYPQLRHSAWNGWTLTDLVFPSFLLMVGLTIVFSTESRLRKGATRRELFSHILRRSVFLFCFGLFVNGFPDFPLATWRIYGVLQRIAICYLIVSVVYLFDQQSKTFVAISACSLTVYYVLMRWVPVPGYGWPTRNIPFLDPEGNLVAYVDRLIAPHRLDEKIYDPEGLISTIPAIATTCLGVLTALWLRSAQSTGKKAGGLFAAGLLGLISGEIWNIWFPINKRLWTSSYVLFAGGSTLLLLFLCYFPLDVKQWRGRWTWPWIVFGSNAIAAYMLSELLGSILKFTHLSSAGTPNLREGIYNGFFKHLINPSFGSLLYSLTFVFLCFLVNLALYRKKIFLKI